MNVSTKPDSTFKIEAVHPELGRIVRLALSRPVRANRVGSCGDNDWIAFARILVVFQPGRYILATVGHELRRGLLQFCVCAGAIFFWASVIFVPRPAAPGPACAGRAGALSIR